MIAFERGNHAFGALMLCADAIHIPAGALAQVWRNPQRQALLSRLAGSERVTIHPLDGIDAHAIGRMLALSGTSDVIDASVVLVSRLVKGVAVTSDPDDLRAIDPRLPLIAC